MPQYEYDSYEALSFVNDSAIRLPRFQRKRSWDEAKGFGLVVSLIKKYPLGVVVLNKDKATKWLLDGRQRRWALGAMLDDPQVVYRWCCRFLKIKTKDTPKDFRVKYWDGLSQYIGANADESDENGPVEGRLDFDAEGAGEEAAGIIKRADMGPFDELLDYLVEVHCAKSDDFYAQLFDVKLDKKIKPCLKYYSKGEVNGVLLRNLIKEYLEKNAAQRDSVEVFAGFVDQKYFLTGKTASASYRNAIANHWAQLSKGLSFYRFMRSLLTESKIGTVTLTDASDLDAQRVFEIINTKGQKLSAAEISSADRHWNTRLQNPSNLLKAHAKTVYKRLEIDVEAPLVRWDVPATLIQELRLQGGFSLFYPKQPKPREVSTASEFESQIGYGFKLLSAIKYQSINKACIDDLAKAADVDWDDFLDVVSGAFRDIDDVLNQVPYFSCFKSWNLDLNTLYGPASSIRVAAQLYLDWEAKGCPQKHSEARNKFIANSLSCFDRLVYERLMREWTSASDSVLKRKLKSFKLQIAANARHVEEHVGEEAWRALVSGACEKNRLGDFEVNSDKSIEIFRGLLLHMSCVEGIFNVAPYEKELLTIDHFTPESLFSSLQQNLQLKGNWLCNLVAVPDKLNKQKGTKPFASMKEVQRRSYLHYLGWRADKVAPFAAGKGMERFMKERQTDYTTKFLNSRKSSLVTFQ
jgi:hypothetical protein